MMSKFLIWLSGLVLGGAIMWFWMDFRIASLKRRCIWLIDKWFDTIADRRME